MRIFNRTNEDIVIDGWIIPPKNWTVAILGPYDVIDIHASFGSAEIVSEYSNESVQFLNIHCFGKMKIIKSTCEYSIEDIYDVIKKEGRCNGDGNGSNWIHREQ